MITTGTTLGLSSKLMAGLALGVPRVVGSLAEQKDPCPLQCEL